jgi:hypothetical protein
VENIETEEKEGSMMKTTISKQELATEIRGCLAAGWSASVGASGEVYAGEDSLTVIGGDPIVYKVQAGRVELTDENMMALAEEALSTIAYMQTWR